MKNLENKILILNENKGENTLYDYLSSESQSDPNFFRWLFDEDLENNFDSSLNDEQKQEFATWLETIRVDELLEKYIIVKFDNEIDNPIRMTRREHFEKVNLCDCYSNYGNKVDCYEAGCYSFENSGSSIFEDFYAAISENIGPFGSLMNDLEITNSDLVDWLSDMEDSVAYKTGLDQFPDWVKMVTFFINWRSENETHTEVTAWTYHDSHNFKTVVLDTDFGEPDCIELEEEQQRAILAEYPGVPYIEGTHACKETENFIFSFDRWATNPWICYIERN